MSGNRYEIRYGVTVETFTCFYRMMRRFRVLIAEHRNPEWRNAAQPEWRRL
jgi:hypothetical protein